LLEDFWNVLVSVCFRFVPRIRALKTINNHGMRCIGEVGLATKE
jgi:hypothetical protein